VARWKAAVVAPVVGGLVGYARKLMGLGGSSFTDMRVVREEMRADGVGGDYRMVYREEEWFRFLPLDLLFSQVWVVASWRGLAYMFPEESLGGVEGAAMVVTYLTCHALFYTYRTYYMVPRRIYHSQAKDRYRMVLNRAVPGSRPTLVHAASKDLLKKNKKTWILPFYKVDLLAPVKRRLLVDPAAFHSLKDYATLGGR